MEIAKVCFFKQSAFGIKELYELNLSNNKETRMNKNGCEIKEFSEGKAQNKGKRLGEIIRKWDKQYVNRNVLDGIEYNFLVEFADGDIIKVYCKNKFPENFDEFKRIVEEN